MEVLYRERPHKPIEQIHTERIEIRGTKLRIETASGAEEIAVHRVEEIVDE